MNSGHQRIILLLCICRYQYLPGFFPFNFLSLFFPFFLRLVLDIGYGTGTVFLNSTYIQYGILFSASLSWTLGLCFKCWRLEAIRNFELPHLIEVFLICSSSVESAEGFFWSILHLGSDIFLFLFCSPASFPHFLFSSYPILPFPFYLHRVPGTVLYQLYYSLCRYFLLNKIGVNPL